MSQNIVNQSIKLLLSRASSATVSGVADATIKIPGTFALDINGTPVNTRTISGGWGYFANQQDGDWVTAEVRDDDNILGYGAGFVLDTFHDKDLPSANQGWFFPKQEVLELRPLISDDPTDIPAGMYLHILATKADLSSDTFYVNVHWGLRIR
jgi:hypothetical protein